MARFRLPPGIALAATVLAPLVTPPARAQERREPAREQEYVSSAPTTLLLRDALVALKGKEATFMRLELPAGWVGERHYHTGDVFVYVLAGTFVVDVDGEGRKTFTPGQVYHEALNTVMQARNYSAAQPATILVVQVGNVGEPMMLKAP